MVDSLCKHQHQHQHQHQQPVVDSLCRQDSLRLEDPPSTSRTTVLVSRPAGCLRCFESKNDSIQYQVNVHQIKFSTWSTASGVTILGYLLLLLISQTHCGRLNLSHAKEGPWIFSKPALILPLFCNARKELSKVRE